MPAPTIQVTTSTQLHPARRAALPVRIGIVWLSVTFAWIAAGLLGELLRPYLSFDVRRLVGSLLAGFVGVAIVIAACRALDRRTLSSLAFGATRSDLNAFLLGAGLWLALAAIGLVVGALTGTLDVAFAPPTWTVLGWIAFQVLLVFTYEALPEELIWRGYVFSNLTERIPGWLAVLGQAVLFMLWAFAFVWLGGLLGMTADWAIDLDRVILFLTFGTTLALVRLWTGSLWGSIGFHLAFQTVAGLLGLQRLTIVAIPAEHMEAAYIALWFFGVVLGGVLAFVGLVWKGRQTARQKQPA